MRITSSRKDGRGGRVAGVRRNPDSPQWADALYQLGELLDQHHRRGQVSQAALALAVGVSRVTVGRWLDGTDVPPVATQGAVRKWVTARRRELARS